tara:strand:+ start:24566 stop:24913 length:348 start_codon:yes stop_codon:yes gene_type:complete
MPLYVFKNPNTSEVIEVVQSMKEEHVYIDAEGLEWERVWVNPNMAIDTDIDPFSEKDFAEKTKNQKNSTVGELWDQSRELSEKRAKVTGGEDPVRKKYEKDWSKKRKGMKPPPNL